MNDAQNTQQTLSSRNENLFLYDIRMGNPNGDPDENRPRVLPDGTHYVTDVRLKRFIRDYLAQRGHEILVGNIEGRTTNLTGRVAHYLEAHGKNSADAEELVQILKEVFIDLRLFGSSLAFKEGKVKGKKWAPKPMPKTLTGAVQFNHGEVLHRAQEVDIHGTSVFGSDDGKTQGTFTTYFGLRYALIGFNGVANEYAARTTGLTDADYALMLEAMWRGVRSAANTRTKTGQVPRLLLNIQYKPDSEFQFGCLLNYVQLLPADGKEPQAWASPSDYRVDLSRLTERLQQAQTKIERIQYQVSPDLAFASTPPWRDEAFKSIRWEPLDLEGFGAKE